MQLDTIRVQPAPRVRVDFARWAIAQTPPVRTCSHDAFAVPADLFTHMPEDLLVGSLVDGHRYRSPLEDALAASVERESVPGEPLPPVPDSAYPPGATPLAEPTGDGDGQAPTPEEVAVAGGDEQTAAAPDGGDEQATAAAADGGDSSATADGDEPFGAGPWSCDVCPREFDTRRGRDTHRRQAHTEEAR